MKDYSQYKLNIKRSPFDPKVYKARQYLKAIVLPEILDYRDIFDKYFPVIDQGSQGSCAACAGTAMRQWQEYMDTGLTKKLSEQFIYNNRGNLGEEGMYMQDLMKILYKKGICLEELCIYGNTKPPSPSAYADALKRLIEGYADIGSVEELKLALYTKGPCPVAVPVYNYGSRMWYQILGERLLGGHAMCCHPSTSILTDGGYKNIENIEEGDSVLTRGGFKRVINLFKRHVSEELYEIDSNLFVEPLLVTGNHPILAKKCSNKTKFYSLKQNYEFIESSNLQQGYFIKTKIDDSVLVTNNNPQYSPEFMRLLGYYIGDGNVQIRYSQNGNIKSAKLRFTYHRDDKKEIIEDIINIIQQIDSSISYGVYEVKNEKHNIITFYSTDLAKEIVRLCGGANNKSISNEILHTNAGIQLELIKGWFKTDGCGEWLNNSKIFTSERELAEQLVFLLQRCRLSYYINKREPSVSFIKTAYYKTKGGYCVIFHKQVLKDRMYFDGDEICARIKKITPVEYSGDVFNFEVQDTNEYIANGVLVHNCCVGWTKEGFIIRNSWSIEWANDGYTILLYEDFPCMWEEWTTIDAPTVTEAPETTQSPDESWWYKNKWWVITLSIFTVSTILWLILQQG